MSATQRPNLEENSQVPFSGHVQNFIKVLAGPGDTQDTRSAAALHGQGDPKPAGQMGLLS